MRKLLSEMGVVAESVWVCAAAEGFVKSRRATEVPSMTDVARTRYRLEVPGMLRRQGVMRQRSKRLRGDCCTCDV